MDSSAYCNEYLKLLLPHVKINLSLCVWLVKYYSKNIKFVLKNLIENNPMETKENISEIIYEAFEKTNKLEYEYLLKHPEQISRLASNLFLCNFLDQGLIFAREHFRFFTQYFLLLKKIAKLNPWTASILVQNQAIYKLFDFAANISYPLGKDWRSAPQRTRMYDFGSTIDFSLPFSIAAWLISACSTKTMREGHSPETASKFALDLMPPLPKHEVKYIFGYDVSFKQYLHAFPEEVCDMLLCLSWKNKKKTYKIMKDIYGYFSENKHDEKKLEVVLECSKKLIMLPDELKTIRIKEFLFPKDSYNNFFNLIDSTIAYYTTSAFLCLNFLIELGKDTEILIVLKENKNQIKWIQTYKLRSSGWGTNIDNLRKEFEEIKSKINNLLFIEKVEDEKMEEAPAQVEAKQEPEEKVLPGNNENSLETEMRNGIDKGDDDET